MTELTIPGGDHKGKTLRDAPVDALNYWSTRIDKSLVDGTSRYPAKDKSLLDGMRAELRARGGAATAPRQASQDMPGGAASQAMARRAPGATSWEKVAGSSRDPVHVNEVLAMTQRAHVITPMPACGRLLEGTAIAFAVVRIDSSETYPLPGGKVALLKVALDKIALAAGVSWDAKQSGRLDDGSDPHYCAFQAVGSVRDFDGRELQLVGSREIDLRDGSAQVTHGGHGGKPMTADALAQARKFILPLAESKARNRAIRSLGVKTGYSPSDLERPFIVAKIQFTGETSDPETKRIFAEATAARFLGASNAMYGGAAEPRRLSAPPAVRSLREEVDAGCGASCGIVPPGQVIDAPQPQQQAAQPARSAPADEDSRAAQAIDRGEDPEAERDRGDDPNAY